MEACELSAGRSSVPVFNHFPNIRPSLLAPPFLPVELLPVLYSLCLGSLPSSRLETASFSLSETFHLPFLSFSCRAVNAEELCVESLLFEVAVRRKKFI
jgi:hypothetical protein